MKQHKKRFWGLIWSTTGLCAVLLLLNLASSQHQVASAHNPQNDVLQTGMSPIEILVNNPCSEISVREAKRDELINDPTKSEGEKDEKINEVKNWLYGQDGNPARFLDVVEIYRFGDEDNHYYRFWGKQGNWYSLTTQIFNGPEVNAVVGLDTALYLYRNNPLEHPGESPITFNDDKSFRGVIVNPYDPYESEISYYAEEDRYYWIRVENRVENGNGTYCMGIRFDTDKTTGTDTTPDACEPNNSLTTACELQIIEIVGSTVTATSTGDPTPRSHTFAPIPYIFNFKPLDGLGPDLDYYKIWAKSGERYTCETANLSQGNDTRMIFYNLHGAIIGSNDDITQSNAATPVATVGPNSRSSKAEVNVGYTGWLYILVEPVVEVNFTYGHLYTYQSSCSADIYHAPIDSHSPPANSQWDAPPAPSSGILAPTEIVAEATATAPVLASKPEAVSFVALPPRTPTPPPAQPGLPVTFSLQIYYDQNNNQQKDADEGVANVPVFLYTGLSDTPIQAITTDGGAIFVSAETASGTVQLFVPYLNINQEISVADVQDIRLRIASR